MATRTSRRRTRLHSSQFAAERWRPLPAFVVLAMGLLVGLALGLRDRPSDQSVSLRQHYLLLVSDRYAQGAPLADLRARLLSIGYTNPTAAVLGAADQLASSPDSVQQQEADQLRQFAQALATGAENRTAVATAPAAPGGIGPTPPAPTATIVETPAGVVATSTATPAPSETPLPTATTPAARPTDAPATATPPPPTPTPKATAAPAKPGVVSTAGGASAILRAGPSSKAAAVATVPNGAKIAVYGRMNGEALNPPEATWYHVVYQGKPGYLYARQLKISS